MEFEFRKDFITEQANVKVSMGHEAFAIWLEQEGQAVSWTDALVTKVSQLQQRVINEFKLVGSEFSLLLNQSEAVVINHSLVNHQDDIDLEVDMNFYDLESEACCGLEDFSHFIESWQAFIQE